MKAIDYRFDTSLLVKAVADAFREGISQPRGLLGFFARIALDWEFFEAGNDPFSVPGDDRPVLSVGASYGLRQTRYSSSDWMRNIEGSSGGAGVVKIWDRRSHRQVSVLHAGNRSPASRRCLRTFFEIVRASDPGIVVTETRVRI